MTHPNLQRAYKELVEHERPTTAICPYPMSKLRDRIPREGDVIKAIRVPRDGHYELQCADNDVVTYTLYAGSGAALWDVNIPLIGLQYSTLRLCAPGDYMSNDNVEIEWLLLPFPERQQVAQGGSVFSIGQGTKFITYRGRVILATPSG